jgi:hypothetical protein
MNHYPANSLILSVVVALSLTAEVGRTAEVVSNLSEPGSGSLIASPTFWLGSSFTTDNQSYILNSLTLSVDAVLGPVSITLSIFEDQLGNPSGSALESIANVAVSSAGNQTFTSTGLSLSANTTYWVVFAEANNDPNIPVWFATSSANQSGSWAIGDSGRQSNNSGSSWSSSVNLGKFSVDASPVPEPGVAVLSLLGLALVVFRRRNA